jgi:hypothetical protein
VRGFVGFKTRYKSAQSKSQPPLAIKDPELGKEHAAGRSFSRTIAVLTLGSVQTEGEVSATA